MMDDLQRIIEENCKLVHSESIIVGVSGGADSLTLLDFLVRSGHPVVVGHFNHRLRPEASEEARIVERLAETLKIPFILGETATPIYAQEQKLSIEEAARELRYRFLFKQAEKHHAQAVAVAHNADDQVETVLMHLLRGAGLDGLTGMPYRALPNPWSKTIPLVRPLLHIWRAEIESYCTERGLNPIVDATNADTTYFRNRLRHELIPELETYVPGFRRRLHQTADLLTADHQVLDDLTETTWLEVVQEMGAGHVTLLPLSFRLHPLALRRRLIRKAISHLRPGARDVDFALVQRALDFAAHPTATGQADLGLGLRISLERDRLILSEWGSEIPMDCYPLITAHFSLPIPGELDLGNGWTLRAEIPADITATQKAAQENRDPYRVWIDLGNQHPLLDIRPRRPGDRFQPLGMDGKSMKISDFMINQKIPQRVRAGWPLVCAGTEIVWVPGYRLGHSFRLWGESKRIVTLYLERAS